MTALDSTDLSRAFYGWNHEIRTPLMSLSNCVEILKRADLDAEAIEAVAEIERQVMLLRVVADSLLRPDQSYPFRFAPIAGAGDRLK